MLSPLKLITIFSHLVAFALFLAASAWLDQVVSGRLSVVGYLAFGSGRSVGVLALILAMNLPALRALPPNLPARIDASGNRVLQGVWRETGGFVPSLLGWIAAAVAGALCLWICALDIVDDVTGAGDRPIGFLAGVGSVIVVGGPFFALVLAVARLGPKVAPVARPLPLDLRGDQVAAALDLDGPAVGGRSQHRR